MVPIVLDLQDFHKSFAESEGLSQTLCRSYRTFTRLVRHLQDFHKTCAGPTGLVQDIQRLSQDFAGPTGLIQSGGSLQRNHRRHRRFDIFPRLDAQRTLQHQKKCKSQSQKKKCKLNAKITNHLLTQAKQQQNRFICILHRGYNHSAKISKLKTMSVAYQLLFTISFSLFILCKSVYAVQCEYIENVIRGQEDTEGVLNDPLYTDQCLRGEGKDAYTSNELALSRSTIPILKKHSVRNMPWLVAIYCIHCRIDLIEAGAFYNVQNITEFEFSYGVLTEIRRGIFDVLPHLEVLDLRGNKIYNIDDLAFANMPVLRHLNLNGNEMEYFKREWFTNTSSIVTIKFVKNKLRTIPPQAFVGWEILQNAYFDDNEITIIHRDAFKGVKFMFNLGLSNNRLTKLDPNIFPNPITIEVFDISTNKFNYLPRKTLKQVKIDRIYLEGNPWTCQCYNIINFWLFFIDGTIKPNSEDPECYSPNLPVCVAGVASTCLERVDSDLTNKYFANEFDESEVTLPVGENIPGVQNIYVKTWGCAHNSSDSEYMAGQLSAYGYNLTDDKSMADLWLLNSCTVKNPAEDHFRSLNYLKLVWFCKTFLGNLDPKFKLLKQL
ncbi:unnamed protein product [Ceutorhynchus assimilis]|uniref:MTTase N-terminal domain-containing protein n=1 Tax=Ceutorhynchus assimilis TaxID=467358 RepID=A0A9N9MG92_9CUCU|nr:unnamed protein product [Ceutorhynchus assimilis]